MMAACVLGLFEDLEDDLEDPLFEDVLVEGGRLAPWEDEEW